MRGIYGVGRPGYIAVPAFLCGGGTTAGAWLRRLSRLDLRCRWPVSATSYLFCGPSIVLVTVVETMVGREVKCNSRQSSRYLIEMRTRLCSTRHYTLSFNRAGEHAPHRTTRQALTSLAGLRSH